MNIRKQLDEIILENNTKNWWKPKLFIKNTLDKLPKEIKVLRNPPKHECNYNCFIYALGLSENKKIIKESKGFIYDIFFLKLLEKKELEYTNNPQKEDWIIYRDLENYPKSVSHIGIIDENNKIISKWSWGPLIKHDIFDVPQSYGNNISYVKSISKNKVKQLYLKYKKFNKKTNSQVEIKTKNLLIKPISLNYREDFLKEYDEEVTKFIYPKPFDREGVISYIEKSIEENNSGKSFVGVILNKNTKEFLGVVEIENIDTKTPNLNLWVKKTAQNKGYGKETIVAIKSWIDNNLDYDYLLYSIADINLLSKKIVESLKGEIIKEYDDYPNEEEIIYHWLIYKIPKS